MTSTVHKVAQRKVLSFAAKVPVGDDSKARIRNDLYRSASRLSGGGLYFADDAGKIDQYVVEDQRYDAANALHQQLYSGSRSHPGSVFYAFVFRVTLGHSVKYAKFMPGGQEPCFNPNSRRRELKNIPNTETPTPYHSLVAGGAGAHLRYNEYVVFHADQTYPEYLLAFQRR